ncbi:MAG: Type 1 glutamine amidotransferase-like domain-containing protein [Candidatus Woesearchaeota archaeon]
MGKIIAIGGGEIGRPKEGGGNYPVETIPIDKEIILQTGKKHPKLLLIPTASSDSEGYFDVVKKHFGKRLGCNVDVLYLLKTKPIYKSIREKIMSSDIIYVGGGNTLLMMNRWKKLGVDKIILEAYEKGKVLSGVSAGALCWFKYGNSDSWKFYDKNRPLIKVSGLGLINALGCPHYSGSSYDRVKSLRIMMKKTSGIAIGLDGNCAIELIDDKYRIISSKNNANAYKVYWKKGKFYNEKITKSKSFQSLRELLTK